ncbi:MAG: hypothetical protein U5N55_03750 [Cypionkella sp.]|nr:hypothetical protein [Cypionkella sp.]
MPQQRQPLFLARANYRKRRLRDGARILPVFGAMLLCWPLLWPATAPQIVAHWLFLFGAWAGLIAVAAVLSRGLADAENSAHGGQDSLAGSPPDDAMHGL